MMLLTQQTFLIKDQRLAPHMRSLCQMMLIVHVILLGTASGFTKAAFHQPGVRVAKTNTVQYANSDVGMEYSFGSSATRTLQRKPVQSVSSRNQDKDFDEEYHKDPVSMQMKWWGSFFAPAVKHDPVDDTSNQVDEYLEFLDRRYHRLRENEMEAKPKFAAWKWLMQGSVDEVYNSAKEENALYALGVAGLASQRLLQKHQLLLQEGKGYQLENVSASAQDVSISKPTSAIVLVLSTFIARISPYLELVSSKRAELVQLQSRYFRIAAKTMVKNVVRAPKLAAKAIWKYGGGRKNVTYTLAVVSTLTVCVLRPLAAILVRECLAARQA